MTVPGSAGHSDMIDDARVFAMKHLSQWPSSVVLDTSFVLDALDASADDHACAAEFLEHLIDLGTVMFFDDLLEFDLVDRAVSRLVSTGVPPGPRAVRLLRDWQGVISRADARYVELPDLVDDALYFVERCPGLGASDAAHASIAVAAHADAIVSTDPRFGAVPASLLSVIVPERHLGEARRLRPDRS